METAEHLMHTGSGLRIAHGLGVVCLTAVLVLFLHGPPDSSAANPNEVVLGAYFISWGIYGRGFQVSDLPARQITHLFYAFAVPRYDDDTDRGELVSPDPGADAISFPALRELKEAFPHLHTSISVGGWTGSGAFSDIMASSNARMSFVDSCVNFMTNNGFDGIDLDWEYPVEGGAPGMKHSPADADNYLSFVQLLRLRLSALEQRNGRAYTFTIAASAGYNTLTNRFRIAEMAEYLDWINVMAYDLSGTWDPRTGHHAPLYGNPGAVDSNFNVCTSIEAYLAAGVSPGKIVAGLPYYGRSFAGVSSFNDGLFQTHSGDGPGTWEAGVVDYDDCVLSYISTNGYTRYWDSVACAPYLFNAESNVFITYEDPESIRLKTTFVQQLGLRGLMCWSIDADTDTFDLQRAAYRSFHPLRVEDIGRAPDPSSHTCRLSWTGIRGETCVVETRDTVSSGDWTPCTSLADTNGTGIFHFAGNGHVIRVVDTNTEARPTAFYGLRVLQP